MTQNSVTTIRELIAFSALILNVATAEDTTPPSTDTENTTPIILSKGTRPEFHVKFADENHLYIQNAKLASPDSSTQTADQIAAINALIQKYQGHLFSSFDKNTNPIIESGHAPIDKSLCYVIIMPPDTSFDLLESFDNQLFSFPIVNTTWTVLEHPPLGLPYLWTYMPDCAYYADTPYFDTLRLIVSNETRTSANRTFLSELKQAVNSYHCEMPMCLKAKKSAKTAERAQQAAEKAVKQAGNRPIKLKAEKLVTVKVDNAEKKTQALRADINEVIWFFGGNAL